LEFYGLTSGRGADPAAATWGMEFSPSVLRQVPGIDWADSERG